MLHDNYYGLDIENWYILHSIGIIMNFILYLSRFILMNSVTPDLHHSLHTHPTHRTLGSQGNLFINMNWNVLLPVPEYSMSRYPEGNIQKSQSGPQGCVCSESWPIFGFSSTTHLFVLKVVPLQDFQLCKSASLLT